MYQEVYNSPWLVTLAVWVIAVVGLWLWLRRETFLTAFLALFTVVILGDALRSGDWSPLHLLKVSEFLEDPIGLLFVMAGDLRYFLLIERFAWRPQAKPRDATAPQAVLATILISLIVPLTLLFLQHFVSARLFTGFPQYLGWECPFLALAIAYRAVILRRRLAAVPAPVRAWLFEVTDYEIVVYLLWIGADVLLITGHEWAYLLRIVPNFLYYGFFLPFVAFRAPPEVTG